MEIKNLLNRPRMFTLTNGDTLRLMSYEKVKIDNSQVTEEMRKNEIKGFISLVTVIEEKPKKKNEKGE